jgi:hypothetical protein
LPKSLEKAIYSANKGKVIIKGRGLHGKALYIKEYIETNSGDKKEEDLREYIN